jgi:hypothetical protein
VNWFGHNVIKRLARSEKVRLGCRTPGKNEDLPNPFSVGQGNGGTHNAACPEKVYKIFSRPWMAYSEGAGGSQI